MLGPVGFLFKYCCENNDNNQLQYPFRDGSYALERNRKRNIKQSTN